MLLFSKKIDLLYRAIVRFYSLILFSNGYLLLLYYFLEWFKNLVN